MLKGIIEKIDSIEKWDCFIKDGVGGTLFHEKWYLFENNVFYAACVIDEDSDDILAVMPLYNYPGEEICQSTKFVPYSGPVLCISDRGRKNQVICRSIYDVLIKLLQETCKSICFALSVDFSDIAIFIQNGFVPEVRYTYHVDLSLSSQKLFSFMSDNRQRDIIKSRKRNLQIENSSTILNETCNLLFWCAEKDKYLTIKKTNKILAEKRGIVLNAFDEKRNIAGQLFLAWGHKKAYTLFSYYDKKYANQGVATRLYFEALLYAKEVLKVETLDLEGSVLKGVETFYQTLGGDQIMYFNLHWKLNRNKLLEEDFYNYD